jgi:hypothetical protein
MRYSKLESGVRPSIFSLAFIAICFVCLLNITEVKLPVTFIIDDFVTKANGRF